MSKHSFVKMWVHLIWGTYQRQRILLKDVRKSLFEHLIRHFNELKIETERINIQMDHVHCLISLPADQNIAFIAKLIKGESSRWINENNLIMGKFRWQTGFGAFSVSSSQLETVKNYIANQDLHHENKSFSQEYKEWAEKYGVWKEGVKA